MASVWLRALMMPPGEEGKSSPRYWQLRILWAVILGNLFSGVTRRGLGPVIPGIVKDMNVSSSQVSSMASFFNIAFAASKPLAGYVVDKGSPRTLLTIGLLLFALLHSLLAVSSTFSQAFLAWTLSGFVHALGWAPCARLLTTWFSPSERGWAWSIASIPTPLAGVIANIGQPWVAEQFQTWRAGLHTIALCTLLVAVYVWMRARNGPELANASTKKSIATPSLPVWSVIVRSRAVWVACSTTFLMMIIRTGGELYLAQFFVEHRGMSPVQAGVRASFLEIGAIVGTILSGVLSDYWHSRQIVIGIGAMMAMASLLALFWMDSIVLLFTLGCGLYACHTLTGLLASEAVPKHACATANGVQGMASYLGAAVGGLPVAMALHHWGWAAFYLGGGMLAFVAGLIALIVPQVRKIE